MQYLSFIEVVIQQQYQGVMRIIGFFLTAATLHLVLLTVSLESTGRNADEYLVGVVLVERSRDTIVADNSQQQARDGLTGADKDNHANIIQTAEQQDAPPPVKKRPSLSAENIQQQDLSGDSPPVAVVENRAAAVVPDQKQMPEVKENRPQITSAVTSSGEEPAILDLEAEFVPALQAQQPEPVAQRLNASTPTRIAENSSTPNAQRTQMQRQAQPRYGHNPAPAYPGVAIRRGWEGTVEFNVKVLPTGVVDEVRLKSSSGYDSLDNAARRAIMSWRFNPAISNGREVESWVVVPVQFVLDDRVRRR